MTWYVKITRATYESVLAMYDEKADADNFADALNTRWQTDEYYVEAYDPEKAFRWR